MRKQYRQILVYGTKHIKKVMRIRKKQCNVSSHMNYLQFAFKGTTYVRNKFFC